jgi:hypothetical protein
MTRLLSLVLVATAATAPLAGQARAPDTSSRFQTQADDYTRYELLAPGSAKFRILYEVTATTSGATHFFNPIRKGSIASDERVVDRMTGEPLVFDVVGGELARAGGVRNADTTTQYIRVRLARPVPKDGEARVLIDKTYYDPKSYYEEGGLLVFARPLGIRRNAIVLPAGYEVVSCNVPSQVIEEADGRIAISFWNTLPAEAPLIIKARPGRGRRSAERGGADVGRDVTTVRTVVPVSPPTRPPSPAAPPATLSERAHQDREIVYFLQQPETHAFDLYHDYTESRPGVDTYLNVVRAGSAVSRPAARLLDTGDELKWEILQGDAITRAKLDVPEVTAKTQVVVFHFPPVKPNGSVRIRMFETYTDSARYRLDGETLVWDRSFGRPANAVVLPAGWYVTNSAIPATVSELADGRLRLDFINPRPDEIAVYLTARRR